MLLALHCTAMQSLPLESGIHVSAPSHCGRLLKIAFGHQGVKARGSEPGAPARGRLCECQGTLCQHTRRQEPHHTPFPRVFTVQND